MRSITTKSGFSCEIDEAVFNDMELFDAMTALDRGDISVLPTVVNKVMGTNKKALYDHLRRDDGIVPIDAVVAEVRDVIVAFGAKNS